MKDLARLSPSEPREGCTTVSAVSLRNIFKETVSLQIHSHDNLALYAQFLELAFRRHDVGLRKRRIG